LYQQKNELKRMNTEVIAVSFESSENAEKYLKDTNLRWPLVFDEKKVLYHYFGMGKGSFREIWGYRTWVAYFHELLQGRFPQKSNGDIYQQGGDIVLDPDNVIRFVHVGAGPADRPEIETLLQLIKE
jgi:hypothetical protein